MIDKEHTGVFVTDGDTLDGHGRAEVDGRQCITHFTRIVTTVCGRALTQLAGGICTPALECVVVEYGAGMTRSRADASC